MKNSVNLRAVSALLATTALVTPAVASAATPSPDSVNVDQGFVDVVSRQPFVTVDEGGIGTGEGALHMVRIWAKGAGFGDNWTGGMYNVGTNKTYVQISSLADIFTRSGSTFTNDNANGATLVAMASGNYLYTARDGTKVEFLGTPFNTQDFPCPGSAANSCRIPLYLQRPSGMKFAFSWDTAFLVYKRLASVTSSAGYSFAVQYSNNNPGTGPAPVAAWFDRTKVIFNNSAQPLSPAPTITYTQPVHGFSVVDTAGRQWGWNSAKASGGSDRLDDVRFPGTEGSDPPDIDYTYDRTTSVLTSATVHGITYHYAWAVVGSMQTVTITDPLGNAKVVTSDLTTGRVTSVKNEVNQTTSYQYDANKRLTRRTMPEGNYAQLTYDSRGNVTEARSVAKSGSGLADIVTSASYDATCANPVTCNKPNSATDAKGNVTDFTYDPIHGGLLTATQPAPTTGAARPQARYSYTQITGAGGDAVYELTGTSACQTGSSCAGTLDEAKSSIAYNSNLLPITKSSGDGTGALTATTAYTYDPLGNMLTVDGPLPGTADTTRYRYDNANRVTGIVSPDPDGAGALKNRAVRITYRPDNQVTKRELGTVNSQSDPDWANFLPLQVLDTSYNHDARPEQENLSKASGVNPLQAMTTITYDALGRVNFTRKYMTVNGQTFGPDRFTTYEYYENSRIHRIYPSASRSDFLWSFQYTANGLKLYATDGESNTTAFTYDGHDRLSKMNYPKLVQGGGIPGSAFIFEQYTYDPNGNVTSRRLPDGTVIATTYDNLDRVTVKDLPGTEPDVNYAYDNFGRITSAAQPSSTLSFGYDALSRKLTETSPFGTVTSQYDLAGRRTQINYPGTGLFVNYEYLVTGETTAIRENGANTGIGVLASFAYDNLGNRLSATFGNGVTQAYTYDPISRLASLGNDLTGTTNDLSATFSYNPASQIVSTTRAGDIYAWTGHYNENKTGIANGINQLTSYGGKTLTYDGRGNMTAYGTRTFGYSSENLMTSGGPGASLSYDPLMRLHQVAGTATTQFGWDDTDMIAEYDGAGALQRRYVMDPGDPAGQPIVWYEGSGTSDRRFLSADERGSIISVTDGTGALLGINRYDEFGQPQSTNIGRFGYTGQAWLPELGLWYYRARMYEPELGRFLQLDPIGYADSPNLYQYVLNDPVNLNDPLGLCIGGGGSAGGSWTNGYSITCPMLDNPFEFDWIRGAFGGGLGRGNGGDIGGSIGGGQPGTVPPPAVVPPSPKPRPKPDDKNDKPKKTPNQCRLEALRKNGLSLGVDVLGIAAEFALPEVSVTASVIATGYIGVVGIGNSIATGNWAGLGANYFGRHAGMAEAFTTGTAQSLARGLSIGALAYSTVTDIQEAKSDYETCISGGS